LTAGAVHRQQRRSDCGLTAHFRRLGELGQCERAAEIDQLRGGRTKDLAVDFEFVAADKIDTLFLRFNQAAGERAGRRGCARAEASATASISRAHEG
jgi:hypothetical protein